MSSSLVPLGQAPQCGSAIVVPSQGPGVLSVSCSTIMAAAPLTCLEAVLNTAEYPHWNMFCPSAKIESAPAFDESHLAAIAGLNTASLLQGEGWLRPGVKFQFNVKMDPDGPTTTTDLEVSRLEAIERDGKNGYRVAWTFRGPHRLVLRAERVQEFLQHPDGRSTEYYCWETFGGVVAYGMRYAVGSKLEDGFGRWMNSLREWVEKK